MDNICQEFVHRLDLQEQVEVEIAGGQTTIQARTMVIPPDSVELQRKWPKFLEAAAER